ncbi:uncharacterized protein FLJ45252-like [Numenius arquata]|uniref:uncharacterized protein FLJ45252-like n=1 Tax=Numenius arquata TaxID=31919 RepID=UPI003D3079C2
MTEEPFSPERLELVVVFLALTILMDPPDEGLQRDPSLFPAVALELPKGPSGNDGLALYKGQPEILKTQHNSESDYLTRDGPSSNSSFYSSEGEGTDHEGDILDCSGSRPLLMDSEEEEETCKLCTGTLQAAPRERREASKEDSHSQSSQSRAGETLFPAFQSHTGEVFNEPDVFATAPFRSSRKVPDEVDVFTKAPFISKGSVAHRHPEEADVFLRAPFTKKKSMEELTSHSVSKEPFTPPVFLSQGSDVQHRANPMFPTLDSAAHGSTASARSQYPSVTFTHPSSLRAMETQENIPSKGMLPEQAGVASERSQGGHVLPQEAVLGSVVNQPFRPQSLSKYSRHYSPEDGQGLEVKPIAAYKVVSQTNRQAIAGSVSVAPLSSRTTELPGADPFASAPFPSKAGKQKP